MLSKQGRGFVDVCSTMQVPTKGIHFAAVGSQELMLARDAMGEIVAFSGFCTHSMGRLEGGKLTGDEITCPHHGARFDFRTGKSKSTCPNLPKFEVRVEGRRVLVRTSS